jgi:ABC-type multidrug transport system ATPase subunit
VRTPVLRASQLCFGYASNALFSDWNAEIPAGVTLIQGGEGRGKTTLLRLLCGELKAQSGTLQCDGVVFRTDPRSDAFEAVTLLDFFHTMATRYPQFDMGLAHELAEELGLTPHLEKTFFMLSTGTKRKGWLAAAFASGAALTLLDEPFAALDKASIDCVTALLQEASEHPTRAWVVADYAPPYGVSLAQTLDLGD